MATPTFLLRVEGVNFDRTLFDTNDLSTIRGGSLALLKLDLAVDRALEGWAKVQKVYSGASQAAFTFAREGAPGAVIDEARRRVADALAGRSGDIFDPDDVVVRGDRLPQPGPIPFSTLTFVVDVVAVAEAPNASGRDPLEAALDRAEARNHARQFRQWTVDPIALGGAGRADDLDGIRPAVEQIDIRGGSGPATRKWVSRSVRERRDFGRRARRTFYRTELRDGWEEILRSSDGDRLGFTDNFEEICAEPPEPRALPESLKNKIAVIYADGNAFGATRAAVTPSDGRSRATIFSERLGELRRRLLERILRWYAAPEGGPAPSPFLVPGGDGTDDLRFETLLWGGDEMAFVLPSWLAVDFVEAFFDATKDWEIGGRRLTHAVGVAVGHYKTPIRQLRHIAKDAAELAKIAFPRPQKLDGSPETVWTPPNTVTFEIFESIAPPDVALGDHRAGVFATAADWDTQIALAKRIAFDAMKFKAVTERIATLSGHGRDEAFPRSQLYAALRTLRALGLDQSSAEADEYVEKDLAIWARRMGRDEVTTITDLRPPPAPGDEPIGTAGQASGSRAGLALDVALLVHLWDYVHPLTERYPTFPALKD